MNRFDPRQQQRGLLIRVNQRIRAPEVRVIDPEGSMIGVMPTADAIAHAQKLGLDLVEVDPKAVPPVCKILDFGKYKYEHAKQAREQRRKQTVIDIKEIKFRPKTDDHDLEFKTRAARRFLEAGNKVKFTVRFRGREITHPEIALRDLEAIAAKMEDIGNVETRPAMEGKAMTLIIAPKPQVLQRVSAMKAQKERERQRLIAEGRAAAEERAAEAKNAQKARPSQEVPTDGDQEQSGDK